MMHVANVKEFQSNTCEHTDMIERNHAPTDTDNAVMICPLSTGESLNVAASGFHRI